MAIALAAVVSSFKKEDVKSYPIIHPEYVVDVFIKDMGIVTLHQCHTTTDNGKVLLQIDLATNEIIIQDDVILSEHDYAYECICSACGFEWWRGTPQDIKACVHCPICDEKCDWDYCIWSCGDCYCESFIIP